MEEKDFSKSIKLTFIILFGASLFWFLFACQMVWAYDPGGSPLDLKKNSRMNDTILIQPGTGTSGGSDTARFRTFYGTQACVGVGSNGYLPSGTLTGLPYIDYLYGNGSSTINFSGFTHVAIGGSDIPSSSSVTGKIDAVAGTGTTNVFTDTTLAGQGTLTATMRANGADISPTEVGYLDGVTSNIQTQITTATGSITNHTHTGSDGTTQIAHDNVTGTGANSHATIDNFIASKASASGLASLDANSLVVQNPASGTSTPGVNKIIMSDGAGKVSDGWLSDNVTKLGTPTTDNISEGSTNKYYTDARVNATIGSSSITSPQVSPKITFTSPAAGQFLKIVDSQGNVENGTSSVSMGFDGITGTPTDNSYFSATPSTNKVPYTGTSTNLNSWIDNTIISIPATTTAITGTSASGRWYNLQQTVVIDSNTKLLLNMDNPGTSTFVDSSGLAHTITANGNAIGTTTSKYGSGALATDGNGDFLSIPDNEDYELGNSDFALTGWVYTDILNSAAHVIYSKSDNTSVSPILVEINTSNLFHFLASTASGAGWDVANLTFGTPVINTWQYIEVSRSGNTIRLFVDGVQGGTVTTSATLWNNTETLYVGGIQYFTNWWSGKIDEVQLKIGAPGNIANYTVPGFSSKTYNYYSATYIPPGTATPKLIIQDAGTTTNSTYMMANVSTLIVGEGTTTSVIGTATAYNGWFTGAVRATAFNVASTEKIKENIKPIKIKPDLLDAESDAKKGYIANNKSAWIVANQANYTTEVNGAGTGTITIVDNETMESDYNAYIEIQWASDLNQDTYTENIQKGHEKVFWQTFDSMSPKSWNPKDKPNVTERGFVVEDLPEVVKGRDGQSVNIMAFIAYMTRAEQSLKSDTVFALSTLKELLTTGTVTQQKIDYCNDRLEVLVP